MPKGLYLGQKNKQIEKIHYKSGELSLIAKGDGTEIMLQKVAIDEVFIVEPCEISKTMEFFYVLEGKVVFEKNGEKVVLKQGDYFYVHDLEKTIQFKAVLAVTLLYVSTQPIFHFLSEIIRDLTEICKKIEAKDAYTYSHCSRVHGYTMKIGKKLGISEERIEELGFSALFHDIGKINVPDEILNKAGHLNNKEFEYIKKHPSDGVEFVGKTYYKNTGQIIEQHHERLDGSGYPHGLKGEEILLEAKIIAVADTYDAMTTDRPYRKALSAETALNELKRLSGIHYDEKIVSVFEEILMEEGIIKEI